MISSLPFFFRSLRNRQLYLCLYMKKLFPVFLLQFVNWMWFALFIPVLPYLVDDYGQWAVFYGILMSSYSICQFFASPLFGAWSDKIWRRPLLIRSQAGTLVSLVFFGVALWFENVVFLWVSWVLRWVLASRMMDGVTWWNGSVANAYLSDVTSNDEKTKVFGMVGAMIWVAMIVWPAIGSWSYSRWWGYLWPIAIGVWLSFITLLLLIFKLPESLPVEMRSTDLIDEWKLMSITRRFDLLKSFPELKKWFALYALFGWVFVAYTSTIALYFKDVLHLSPEQLWYLFSAVWLFLIVHMWFTVRKLSEIWSDEKMFMVWMIVVWFSLLWFFLRPDVWWYIAIAFFLDAGIALCLSSFKWLITSKVSDKQQWLVTWLEESIMAASRAIIPVIATWLFALIWTNVFGGMWLVLVLSLLYWRKKLALLR